MSGFLVVVIIIVLAGAIAYVGDRVGHQVGRKRLTLFGLRPKYTSTIVAVGTGMLIALIVTMGALAASSYVRTAFFRLGTLSSRINELQAQELSQKKELEQTRSGSLAVPRLTLIANTAWTFDLAKSDADQLGDFGRFFDAVVRIANQQLATPAVGLRKYTHKSSEPAIRAELQDYLRKTRELTPDSNVTVLFLPVASQNLFRGEVISFSFQAFEDKRLAKDGETLASIDITGGAPSVDIGALVLKAGQTLAARGYPPQFLYPPLINSTQVQAVTSQIPRLRGKYRLIAKTPIDLYPHSGPFPIDVELEPIH
ncbi:MAG TPA: DUF3084 domain-containing protein [Candidatus Lustribacter sp.]